MANPDRLNPGEGMDFVSPLTFQVDLRESARSYVHSLMHGVVAQASRDGAIQPDQGDGDVGTDKILEDIMERTANSM